MRSIFVLCLIAVILVSGCVVYPGAVVIKRNPSPWVLKQVDQGRFFVAIVPRHIFVIRKIGWDAAFIQALGRGRYIVQLKRGMRAWSYIYFLKRRFPRSIVETRLMPKWVY